MNMDNNINKSILFLDTVICNIISILSGNKYDKDCTVGLFAQIKSEKKFEYIPPPVQLHFT